MPEPSEREQNGRDRKVKIVCTLGPATQSPAAIARLIQEGMDVARLNFSHGTHDVHRETFRQIRAASSAAGRFSAVMQDLQGPKIRVGKLPPEGIELREGDEVLLYPEG